jgi:hypothetical protein
MRTWAWFCWKSGAVEVRAVGDLYGRDVIEVPIPAAVPYRPLSVGFYPPEPSVNVARFRAVKWLDPPPAHGETTTYHEQ